MGKKLLLDNYLGGAAILQDRMATLSEELVSFRPDIMDSWSIKEHVVHLVDSDINGSMYIKTILAQPKTTVFRNDSTAWHECFKNKDVDISKYVEIFKLLRQLIYELLKDENESKFDEDYIIIPYNGEMLHLNIGECLESFTNHLLYHVAFIDRNIREYRKLQPVLSL
jgi:hypothetical protein